MRRRLVTRTSRRHGKQPWLPGQPVPNTLVPLQPLWGSSQGGGQVSLLKLLQSIGAPSAIIKQWKAIRSSLNQKPSCRLHDFYFFPMYCATHWGKQYGGSTVWGQEFTELLAFTDFKSKETTYPWIRLALATCQMCAPKQFIRDGISRFVTSGDFSKLKQKSMVVQLVAAEKLLQEAWVLCSQSGLTLDQQAQPMGRYLTRLALVLTGKGSKGAEGKVFKEMNGITDVFTEELMNMKTYGKLESQDQTASSTASVEKAVLPAELEARVVNKSFSWLSYIMSLLDRQLQILPSLLWLLSRIWSWASTTPLLQTLWKFTNLKALARTRQCYFTSLSLEGLKQKRWITRSWKGWGFGQKQCLLCSQQPLWLLCSHGRVWQSQGTAPPVWEVPRVPWKHDDV